MPGVTACDRLSGPCHRAASLRWPLLVALGLGLTGAGAEPYPSKPIKLIVPYTPGSPVDVLARVVTQQAVGAAGADHRDRQPARGRYHDRQQACGRRRTGRLYAADRRHEPDHFGVALSQSRLRSGQEFRRRRHAGEQPAGAGDRAQRSGEDRSGVHRLRQGPSGQVELRLRTGDAAAHPGRSPSRPSPAPISPAFPTRAARKRSPTCWAAGST